MNNQNFYLRLIALLLIIMAVFFYNGTVKDKEQAQDIAPARKSGKKNTLRIANRMNSLTRMMAHRVLPTVMLRNPSR